jgi:hypothetical protein
VPTTIVSKIHAIITGTIISTVMIDAEETIEAVLMTEIDTTVVTEEVDQEVVHGIAGVDHLRVEETLIIVKIVRQILATIGTCKIINLLRSNQLLHLTLQISIMYRRLLNIIHRNSISNNHTQTINNRNSNTTGILGISNSRQVASNRNSGIQRLINNSRHTFRLAIIPRSRVASKFDSPWSNLDVCFN